MIVLAVLAAALIALPVVAGSAASPTVEAENKPGGGIYNEETHAWTPSQVSVGEGGVVTFQNTTAVAHGVEWRSGPGTPSCSVGVPVGTTSASSATNWSGTCTFAKPGTYVFYCTVHKAAMTGRVIVSGNGSVTAEPPPGTPESPYSPPGGSPGSPGGSGSGGAGGSGSPGAPGPVGLLLVGGSKALKLPAVQHGSSVHGSLAVSPAGAGSRLEVALFATGGSLATVHNPSRVRVGRLVRASLRAGTASFSVALDGRARLALDRRHRLGLTMRVVLAPGSGRPAILSRALVLHR